MLLITSLILLGIQDKDLSAALKTLLFWVYLRNPDVF